jgi:hypothetical protein
MNSDQNGHRPLGELLNYSGLASELIKEAEMQFLHETFYGVFRIGVSPGYLEQLKVREEGLQRIRRLFLAFDLATLIPGAALAWKPRRKLMRIMDSCFGLENLSSSATRRGPKVIVRAMSNIADVLEFTLAVRSALTRRKSTSIKVNRELEQLIIATVRSSLFDIKRNGAYGKPELRLPPCALSNN